MRKLQFYLSFKPVIISFSCRVQTRECFESCKLDKYIIPVGCFVQIDAQAVHQNVNLWGPEDPKKFVPER